jgi:hypothetical protein
MGMAKAPDNINRAWESACKVMLGQPVGPIDKFDAYLWNHVEPYHLAKSAISGKEVVVTGDYKKGARFISGEELQEYTQIIGKTPLNVNELKDIDSIISAIGERIYYSGNDILGNSGQATLSNRVVDSTFVYKAHDIFYSKYVTHTYLSKYSEYIFGCESVGKGTHFAVKSFETYDDSRLFETVRVYESSDIIYSANLEACQNCLFCFNLRSKRRCVGNVELPDGKFNALKNKLQEDIRATLQAKKSAPSIMEIIGGKC